MKLSELLGTVFLKSSVRYVTLVFCMVLLIDAPAQALPNTVRLGMALGPDDGGNTFNLPLNTALTPGGRYKLQITAVDADADGINQQVSNFTFNITIANGTLTGFKWLVTGGAYPKIRPGDICDPNITYPPNDPCDPNESDLTNSVTGNPIDGYIYDPGPPPTFTPVTIPASPIDKPGQVSTDKFSFPAATFPGFSFPGFSVPASPPLPLGVAYFTVGAAASPPLRINFDSDPYVSGLATDNSHYAVDGVSYNINQGRGLAFHLPNPADMDNDFSISQTEALTYVLRWKQQAPWPRPPSPINPPLYALLAQNFFKQGLKYHVSPTYLCGSPDPSPGNCWVAGP